MRDVLWVVSCVLVGAGGGGADFDAWVRVWRGRKDGLRGNGRKRGKGEKRGGFVGRRLREGRRRGGKGNQGMLLGTVYTPKTRAAICKQIGWVGATQDGVTLNSLYYTAYPS